MSETSNIFASFHNKFFFRLKIHSEQADTPFGMNFYSKAVFDEFINNSFPYKFLIV